jgi:hypothetical protein
MTDRLTALRATIGQQIVPAEGALRHLIHALKHGISIGLLIDQHTHVWEGGAWVNLFGVPAGVSRTPSALSRKQKVPIIFAWSRPLKDGRYRIEPGEIFLPDSAQDDQARTQQLVEGLRARDPAPSVAVVPQLPALEIHPARRRRRALSLLRAPVTPRRDGRRELEGEPAVSRTRARRAAHGRKMEGHAMVRSCQKEYPRRKHPAHMVPVERQNRNSLLFVTCAIHPRGHFLADADFHVFFLDACRRADAWRTGRYVINARSCPFFLYTCPIPCGCPARMVKVLERTHHKAAWRNPSVSRETVAMAGGCLGHSNPRRRALS